MFSCNSEKNVWIRRFHSLYLAILTSFLGSLQNEELQILLKILKGFSPFTIVQSLNFDFS